MGNDKGGKMREKLLKCTNETCGMELPEKSFYKAPGNNQRNNRDYFCKCCRNARRKELRDAKGAPAKIIPVDPNAEPRVLCHGPCGLTKPVSDFHKQQEHTNRFGRAYWCQVCLKEKTVPKPRKATKSTTQVDDEYIFC